MAALNADMVTVVGHKFGAPKGVGALVVAPHVTVARMLCGECHTRGSSRTPQHRRCCDGDVTVRRV